MEEYNYLFLLCNKLFTPIEYHLTIISKGAYCKPSKQAGRLVSQISKEKTNLLGILPLAGLALEDRIILSKGSEHNSETILHEKFHQKVAKNNKGWFESWHPYVLEEAFAESYAAVKLYSAKKLQKMVEKAEETRDEFNSIWNDQQQALSKKIFSLSGMNSYPVYMQGLQYTAYLDLGIRFFRKHKINKTLDYLVKAEQIVDLTGDHHNGIEYLNSKLSKKEAVENPLVIKSIYKTLKHFLCIKNNSMVLDFYAVNQPDYAKLIRKFLEIFNPYLKNEKTDISPPELRKYLENKSCSN